RWTVFGGGHSVCARRRFAARTKDRRCAPLIGIIGTCGICPSRIIVCKEARVAMTIDSNVAMNPGSRNSAGTTRRAFRGRWAVALLLSLISLTLGKSAGAEDYLYNPPVRLLRSGSWISVVRNPPTRHAIW